jgi:hypothetical protein
MGFRIRGPASHQKEVWLEEDDGAIHFCMQNEEGEEWYFLTLLENGSIELAKVDNLLSGLKLDKSGYIVVTKE